MQENFVLTFTGADRVGIVESLTGLVFHRGGNVETSRMARLGGEFAVLMLVSLPPKLVESLKSDLETLASQGHKVTLCQTHPSSALSHPQGTTYHIAVEGADHEGIVHSVSRYLAERGINIESLDTEVSLAPMSGTTLFSMAVRVVAPPELADSDWTTRLMEMGDQMNLAITVLCGDDLD